MSNCPRVVNFTKISLRRNGVHLITSTTKLNVFMLTTSKISEGGKIYLITKLNHVNFGKVKASSLLTKKAAPICSNARRVMGGKNNNSIRQTTNRKNVLKKSVNREMNVHKFIKTILIDP